MSEETPRDKVIFPDELQQQDIVARNETPEEAQSLSDSTESQTKDDQVVSQDEFTDTSRTTDEFVPNSEHVDSDDTGNQPENGGWDIAKAETMASVLREDKDFRRDTDESMRLRIEGQEESATLDRLKEESERHRAAGEEIPSDLLAQIDKIEGSYDRASRPKDIRKLEFDNFDLDIRTSTAQELYDINPSMFADMPTSEFIDIINTYQYHYRRPIWEQRNLVNGVQKIIDIFEQCIEEKRGVPIDSLEKGIQFAIKASRIEPLDAYEFKQKFLKGYEGSTDKTIGEIMEEQIALFKESLEFAETRAQDLRDKQSSFLRPYQPKNPLENQDSQQ